MIRNLIYFAILILTISACKKEIKIDIPENERKVVVNGVFNVGEPIVLWVSKSKSMLEKSDIESLDNAEIKLFENDEYITTLETENHFWYEKYNWDQNNYQVDSIYRNVYYSKNMEVSADKKYKIEIIAPGLDKKASVEFKAPTLVPILKLDTTTVKTDQWSSNLQFDLQMDDPGNEENFYVINVKIKEIEWYENELGEIYSSYYEYFAYLETEDILINSGNIWIDKGLIFNDRLFDGKLQHVIFKTIPYTSSQSDTTYYQVILRSISKDYYNYLVTLSLYNNSEGNPIAEPVSVKSNVENGFGIVTAVNQWIDSSIVYTKPNTP